MSKTRLHKTLPPDPELNALLDRAEQHTMTPEERAEQRISWAYGNLALHDPNITKDDVRKAAGKLYGPTEGEQNLDSQYWKASPSEKAASKIADLMRREHGVEIDPGEVERIIKREISWEWYNALEGLTSAPKDKKGSWTR